MPKTPSKTEGTGAPSAASSSFSITSASTISNPDLDIKLDKIKITPFSDAKDWESTIFELKLILKQVWKDTSIDIHRYINEPKYATSLSSTAALLKADELIYYILSVGSVRGSFARNLIMAAQSSTAQPHIPENQGLALLEYFNSVFLATEEHATSLPLAQKKFHSLKQNSKESASAYISRVDLAVSSLTKLHEPVSANTWIYALINGLRPEYSETRNGVLFARPGFDTVIAVKTSITNEEMVLNTTKGLDPNGNDSNAKHKSPDTAFSVNEHKDKDCHYCGKKGHIQPDCRKKKADLQKGKGKQNSPKGKANKGQKGKSKSKGRGRGSPHWNNWSTNWNDSSQSSAPHWNNNTFNDQPTGKGNKGRKGNDKGQGRGQNWTGNFPSDYNGSYANFTNDTSSEHSSQSTQWNSWRNPTTDPDTGFAIFESEYNESDDAMYDALDLHFIALFRQMERRQLLLARSSPQAIEEIALHDSYIDAAAQTLSPKAYALVQSFRALIGYDCSIDSPAIATPVAPSSDHCLMNLDSDAQASSHAHGDASNAFASTAAPSSVPLRLPSQFDVIVDFSPYAEPFTQRVRPTMTHHQLLTILSAVVGVNSALLFTFLNNQIRHGSSCLLCDDPPLYPGCTLRLVKWSFYDARRFYQAYNALPMETNAHFTGILICNVSRRLSHALLSYINPACPRIPFLLSLSRR